MESPNCHYSLATTPSSALRGAHKCQTMHDTGSFALPPSELPRSSAPEQPGQHGLRTGSTELVMPLRARKIGTAARAAPTAWRLALASGPSSRLVSSPVLSTIPLVFRPQLTAQPRPFLREYAEGWKHSSRFPKHDMMRYVYEKCTTAWTARTLGDSFLSQSQQGRARPHLLHLMFVALVARYSSLVTSLMA
ncbi:hypothetical protein ACCO45_001508 [Purpureocillium lilacinum]|uniref:Uncharacterized protein n=1 Tax=Purpureocillium lilacinum TaxID=33203 RepID=A0ACC4E785_PURLI